MTSEEQVQAYSRIRKIMGSSERRGFESSAPGGGFDGWTQKNGIAVWVNPQNGLNIGVKNIQSSGYMGLENFSVKGINHPPRWKMSYAEIAPLWLEGFERFPQFRKDGFVQHALLALILTELGFIGQPLEVT